jgi:RNA 3'-terminal phosphate cyclase (ATP)/RNA 3'-terminal phosphate cyclase (GTP)
MRTLDASYGEGGGQLVRTAVALAAITGEAVRLKNIRARRTPPGLAPQHVAAVRAVAALCGATVDGLAVSSTALHFHPGSLRGGRFQWDVGTAGSLPLVLQAALPVAVASGASVCMTLTGGTDVRAAPPLDYLRHVFLPLLTRLGLHVTLSLHRRGYYPRGGGEIEVQVHPAQLQPLDLVVPPHVHAIEGIVHVANLPTHIAERMRQRAGEVLAEWAPIHIACQVIGGDDAVGQGGAVALWAKAEAAFLGGAAVAERGVPAERIAGTAAYALRDDLRAGATLDVHALDQALIYLALAGGTSRVRVRSVSSHAETAVWLLRQFFPLEDRREVLGTCTQLTLTRG